MKFARLIIESPALPWLEVAACLLVMLGLWALQAGSWVWAGVWGGVWR